MTIHPGEVYDIKPHAIIGKIISIHRKFGLWQSENESFLEKIGKFIQFIILLFLVISLGAGASISDDKSEAIFLASTSIAASLMTAKLLYVLTKRKEILNFLHDICEHSVSDHREFTEINGKLNNFAIFGYCNMISMFASIFGFMILSLPIFSSERRLPLNIAFPLDWKNNQVAYWTAFILIIVAVTTATIVTSFTIIYWYIMYNCSIKYQILGRQFRNMGIFEETNNEDDRKAFAENLTILNKSHQEIREHIKRFESCFSNLFFAQINASNICICGSVFAITFNRNASVMQFIINMIIFVYNSFDIFMVMYFGNEIEYRSNQLTYCIFQSDWMKQSKACQKNILITGELLRHPQELLIFKLYPLNLKTFTSIAKLTYSMFNILQTFGK